MNIKKTTGKITKIIDLSPTAKDIEIELESPINFIAGNFVNIFMNICGENIRRAYSISSTDTIQDKINISVRLAKNGKMTPEFWKENILGSEIELMGPLGLNVADKMLSTRKYLFGFGIGAGVIKSLLDHFEKNKNTKEIFVILGHRNETENLYMEYFEEIKKNSNKINIDYVFSRPELENNKKGYIQDYIDEYDFSDSDIYICGQEKACEQLMERIKSTKPNNIKIFIEGFH